MLLSPIPLSRFGFVFSAFWQSCLNIFILRCCPLLLDFWRPTRNPPNSGSMECSHMAHTHTLRAFTKPRHIHILRGVRCICVYIYGDVSKQRMRVVSLLVPLCSNPTEAILKNGVTPLTRTASTPSCNTITWLAKTYSPRTHTHTHKLVIK